MLQLFFKKWWAVLLQGILLVILGIYTFSHPDIILAGILLWVSLLIIVIGISGIASSIMNSSREKVGASIWWSMITFLAGISLISNQLVTSQAIAIVFALWMFATGILLLSVGIKLKQKHVLGWVVLIAGIIAVTGACMLLTNKGLDAPGFGFIIGMQAVFAGIGLIIYACLKREVVSKLKSLLISPPPKY